MRIHLTNDFHHSETYILAQPGDEISRQRVAQVRRRLCGIADCTCSGDLGTRGPQPESSLALMLGRSYEYPYVALEREDA